MRCDAETPVKIVGGNQKPRVGQLAGRRPAHRALGLARVAQLADPRELGRGVDRADVGVLVERIAQPQRRHALLQRRDHLLCDRLLHEEARAGAADVALVEEDPVDDALDGLVERRVVEHDVGGLAAELEAQPRVRARDAPHDLLADLGRAGERDLVDVRVLDERLPDRGPAGDDVDDARRQVGTRR